jgi:hypothetical protein
MANKIYPKAFERSMKSGLDLLNQNVKAVLIDTGAYTYSDSHEFLSDIPSGARIATSGNMANKSVATVTTDDARFDCDDFTITVGASQPTCEALAYYVDTGVAGTSYLIKYVDSTTGLVYTPPVGGGSVSVQVSANGVMEFRNA